MEGDDLSSSKTFHVKLGLQKDLLKPRVAKKMEGEDNNHSNKKSGAKDRSKQIQIGLDSDDDEPIRSLFKLKRPRNHVKVKPVVDKVEIRDEKLVAGDGDFGGLDDTLASIRKRLKGCKKDFGSVSARPLEYNEDKGCSEALKEKVKKMKSNVKRDKTRVDSMVNGFSQKLESVVEDHKEEGSSRGEGSGNSSDEKIEDSLSCIFQKVQPGPAKKSCMNSCPKQNNKVQTLEHGSIPTSECVSDITKSWEAKTHRTASASNVACQYLKVEDGCSLVTDSRPSNSVSKDSKTLKHQRLDNGFCQASSCKEVYADKNMKSSPDRLGRSSEYNYQSSVAHCNGIQGNKMLELGAANVQERPMMDPCSSQRACDENWFVSGQEDNSESQFVKSGSQLYSMGNVSALVYNGVKLPASTSVKSEDVAGFSEHTFNKETKDACDQLSKGVSTVCISNAQNQISVSSSRKELLSPLDDELSDKPCKISSNNISNQAYDRVLDDSLKANSAALHMKKDEDAENDNRLDIVSPKIEDSCGACNGPNAYDEKLCPSSVSPKKVNYEGNSLETYVHPNVPSISIHKCIPVLHQHMPSDDAMKGTYVASQDSFNDETPPSVTPDENESFHEDAVSIPDSEIKDGKSSSVQRGIRKAKKRRLGDMAYEGDPDWEILVNDQHNLETDQFDSDRDFRTREKSDSSSVSATEGENGGAAAVSVGLKVRAAGPVEKIKFKEFLKRKGGLQEYLECRNQILSLWSKDISRILPLTDCGVTDSPSENESSRTSLIREIYAFLDQSGYINMGVASRKEKAEPNMKHNYKLHKEKAFEVNPGASVADLEDGVSFILGQVKSSEIPLEANNGVTIDENQTSNATIKQELCTPVKLDVSNVSEYREFVAVDIQQTSTVDEKLRNGLADLDDACADSSCATLENTTGAITPELRNDVQSVQSSSCDYTRGDCNFVCDSEGRKKIIVVGAGPAGLTAARHLQRQGFSVTVLEARSRIGGRVYTDRSSLSVPVDLGASIITGVEADVATERRPDPSSLICAQLGLELTVLNSDCPLYDIMTREKVPIDLDEALEAEYNSLLDDMVLLIAQKGEHAMKMSLEDGLEYALKKRRAARSGTDIDDSEVNAFGDLNGSKSCSDYGGVHETSSREEVLTPLERRIMDWHFAHLEYGCAALLKDVSLPYWNQDDVYGGFGGAHCMIKGGYSNVVESLSEGLPIHLSHVVTDISYNMKETGLNESQNDKVKVTTSNGSEFLGDAVLVTVPLGCLKAEAIKFNPPLPSWKCSSIQRLGFGVLNKVVLEFPEVFWDDSVDYFGATAEEMDKRGHSFMFWNVKKTVGAPVLIALVVGKAAVDGQKMSSSDHVSHALMVLRKLFGEAAVPDPVASVVTDWGRDPFSYGAYSYVAIGSSGEDYDILGRPVGNCVFFAGEATCKEHPDTVGGALMSGLREAVRIIGILNNGNDYTAEVEAMEAAERQTVCERDEVRDITKRLEAVEISNFLYKNSLDGSQIVSRENLLREMFFTAKTTAGRLHLAKKLLNLPVGTLKLFAGTRKGLSTLNSWMLDSMGKDGTQLLRHCVRLLVLVSTGLLAVRLSGIGKTVKEKVCVHTSRDIRAIASQLVTVWLEVFRREKASNGGLKLLRHATAMDSSKRRSVNNPASGKPPLRSQYGGMDTKGSLEVPPSFGSHLPSNANMKRADGKLMKVETSKDWQWQASSRTPEVEEKNKYAMSEEELAAVAAAEAAQAAARAAAEAYASSEAKCSNVLQLPKIPSFHKFARREQYTQMDDYDSRRKWSGGILGKQDCLSEIDSRNCRVRDWSVDFAAACVNLNSSRISVDNLSQKSHSNEIACHMNFKEQSGESAAMDSNIFTRAWVDSAGSDGIKDFNAIDRWQSQAAAADLDFFHPTVHILKDEEDSNTSSKPQTRKHNSRLNESSISQVTLNKESKTSHHRGADRIKQAVVDFVASLLMPVYKARKIDREGYKSIMKKTATKVMEQATDAEKTMAVSEFLDSKRKNKIRAFADKLIERHMAMKPTVES
ncbi:lysine-specific histone demethylase 1 homolog 3 isoform X2 [Mercurialis annua]|uniref:lysine-specific histone demethylase 1 homolog 3 isoform X2 n=1 Tax=Mercurialis annua TaxID=3986 RepID=UPI00215E6C09|nr:lysine-specific histone demethylase 1 homolog 3 isoform X2 [Mercurialis annua]